MKMDERNISRYAKMKLIKNEALDIFPSFDEVLLYDLGATVINWNGFTFYELNGIVYDERQVVLGHVDKTELINKTTEDTITGKISDELVENYRLHLNDMIGDL